MASAPAIELEVDYLVYKDSSGAEVVQSVREMAAPTGGIQAFAMPHAPDGWLICDGSNNLLIGDFPALYDATSAQLNATVGSGSTVITINDPEGTTNLGIGNGVRGVGIPDGTTIVQINSGTTATMSNAANANNTADTRFMYWGQGANISTFRIPDFRGRFLRMWTQGLDGASLRFGEHQNDSVRAHRHENWNANSRFASWWNVYDGDLDGSWVATGYDKTTVYGGSYLSFMDGRDAHGNFGDSGIARSGPWRDETHPYNYSVQYCIKY